MKWTIPVILAVCAVLVECQRLDGEGGPKKGGPGGGGGKAPGGKAPGGKAPGGKAPGGKAPGGKAPGGKAPALRLEDLKCHQACEADGTCDRFPGQAPAICAAAFTKCTACMVACKSGAVTDSADKNMTTPSPKSAKKNSMKKDRMDLKLASICYGCDVEQTARRCLRDEMISQWETSGTQPDKGAVQCSSLTCTGEKLEQDTKCESVKSLLQKGVAWKKERCVSQAAGATGGSGGTTGGRGGRRQSTMVPGGRGGRRP